MLVESLLCLVISFSSKDDGKNELSYFNYKATSEVKENAAMAKPSIFKNFLYFTLSLL